MLKHNSENVRIVKYFLNNGPLSAAEACQGYISNNLRSRVAELKDKGFDVETQRVPGKTYQLYFIPPDSIEKNRELLQRQLNG